jgi:hypothetical protein
VLPLHAAAKAKADAPIKDLIGNFVMVMSFSSGRTE